MDFATTSLVSQCNHWIDLGGAACGNEARCRRDESEHSCNREINDGIERVDLEENVLQSSSGENSEKQCGATGAKDKPNCQAPWVMTMRKMRAASAPSAIRMPNSCVR